MIGFLVAICLSFSQVEGFTVSGLSSGGFFSSQFHVAFSGNVTGAAVIAGGPYYCAQGSVTHAETACMSTPALIDISACEKYATTASSQGKIDNISNLNTANVYLYSGTKDTVVNPGVAKQLLAFYQKFTTSGKIVTNFVVASEHAWITNTYGNACAHLGSPYMNNCNFDLAGTIFTQFYGTLNPRAVPVDSNLIAFSQSTYGDIAGASMGKTGYVYVPSSCKTTQCKLHISFHGCQQSVTTVGKDFVTYTGLNDWAESNGIVVIYPQLTTELTKNPQGCWDFWGYTGSDYATKTGKQMAIVFKMAQQVPGVNW